jgi:hypothetical protein
MAPPFLYSIYESPIDSHGWGKLVSPLEGSCGIDKKARVIVAMSGFEGRIEEAARKPSQNLHVPFGVDASAGSPHDLFEIGDIHVLIDHDHDLAVLHAGITTGRHSQGLLRMAGVALFDSHHDQHAPGPYFMAPRALDIRDPGRHELFF